MKVKNWLVLNHKDSKVSLIEFDSVESLNERLKGLVSQDHITGYKVISGFLLRDEVKSNGSD